MKIRNEQDLAKQLKSIYEQLFDLTGEAERVEQSLELPTKGVDLIFAAFNAISDAMNELGVDKFNKH